jgi:hypothetical protein
MALNSCKLWTVLTWAGSNELMDPADATVMRWLVEET